MLKIYAISWLVSLGFSFLAMLIFIAMGVQVGGSLAFILGLLANIPTYQVYTKRAIEKYKANKESEES